MITAYHAPPAPFLRPLPALKCFCKRMRSQRQSFGLIAAALGSTGWLHQAHAFAARMSFASALPVPGEIGGRGQLVLGSKSFTRKIIVEEMGFTPVIRSADIDEASIGDRTADPANLVLQLGLAKAEALLPALRTEAESGALNTALLLTGDQVVVHDGQILEKPADRDEVRANIKSYARSPCRTVGSAVLTDIVTGAQVSGVDTAEIFFKEIPDDVVTKLCDEGTVMQCAGGLMVEHILVQPYITKIDGSIDSVMGLSKTLVDKLLEQIKQPH